jgi:NAD(P)-dependent dehydrogenase (short-subunit alcohol dehydrogenase family)
MRLKGKRALVTGAGSGIGRAIARGFAAEGAAVIVADLIRDRARETTESLLAAGHSAYAVQADVSRKQQVDAMIQTAIDQFGGLDTLVCGAGISPMTPFLDISEEEWDRVIDINLKGPFLCGQAAARHMKGAGGGVIINITSQLTEVAQPKSVHYVASKGGAKMMTKGMVLDLARFKIRINAIAPGLTNTAMTRLDTAEGWAEHEEFMSHIPMGRPGLPEDMIGAAVYLASDDSAYVNGATILVDGGYLAL